MEFFPKKYENYNYDNLFNQFISCPGQFTCGQVPLHFFLLYLIKEKSLLLHGSTVQHIPILQPKFARCFSKTFGNQQGIYATANCMSPIMFAISDGSIKMYYDLYTPGENISASDYLFDQSKYKNEYFAFTNGVIYVLPKHSFVQGKDNEGRLINEWLSTEPVTPLGSIIASPSDFPFFPQKK